MIELPIQAIPNQTMTIRLSDDFYSISIKEIDGLMSMTIVRNDVVIVSNQRLMANYPIIPYEYLENGNFIFLTSNNEYPYYDRFNIDQSLLFASQEELEEIRAV